MALLRKPEQDHGTDLLAEFHEILDDQAVRAQRRAEVVQERLASLEDEHRDLRQLERKHQAAREVI